MSASAVRALPGPGVGIVGGGLLGLSVGYKLAGRGVPVTVYEASGQLGGLAGTTDLGGYEVDRYYHALTLTDTRVIETARELGLEDEIRWRRLGVGFFHDGRLASMSTPKELLSFPGLRARDRARLGVFAARCRTISDQDKLDAQPVEEWVRKTAGDALWERLWRPLLDSKFDGRYDDLPATFLWSRTKRSAATRDKAGHEVMGWIRGGHQRLVDALGVAIRERGGEVLLNTPVRHVPSVAGRAQGVVIDSGFRAHDQVVTTLLRPHMSNLLSEELEATLPPDPNRYLGVVCLVARVRRSVSPYYALNITDRSIPLTSVVETTHVVDPEHVGGHLIYVPRYVRPESEDLERPTDEIKREYLAEVSRMFPEFRPRDVIASQVARARYAEPVHRVGVHRRLPELAPAPGLVVASSAHVYPEVVHAHSIMGVAERTTDAVLDRLEVVEPQREAA